MQNIGINHFNKSIRVARSRLFSECTPNMKIPIEEAIKEKISINIMSMTVSISKVLLEGMQRLEGFFCACTK